MATPPTHWQLPRLRITRDGDWLDDGVEVTHPGILANLRGNLRKDEAGYYIQTRVRIPVEVDDVPWIGVRVEPSGERLRVWLNDGTEELLDPTALRIGAGGVPYIPVKGRTFEARLSRAATYQLLALAVDDGSGGLVLRLGGREVTLATRE